MSGLEQLKGRSVTGGLNEGFEKEAFTFRPIGRVQMEALMDY